MKKFYGAMLLGIFLFLQPLVGEAKTVATSQSSQVANVSYSYKLLKQDLQDAMENSQTTVKLSYSSTMQAKKILEDAKKAVTEIQKENSYIAGIYKGYKSSASTGSGMAHLTMQISYLMTPAEEAFVDKEVQKILKKIMNPKMTDVQKVRAINDYIVLNTTYATKAKTSVHSPYTLFKEGKGVCQAYALATHQLLTAAGLETYYVTGKTNTAHAWNLVKVDGQWYHLDTTWNDPTGMNDANYIRYSYFLLSDKQIKKDHQIDKKNYPVAKDERFTALHSVEKPVEVNGVAYYSHIGDKQKLYQVNFNSKKPAAKKVSNTRVQHLVYVDKALFFSNYSNGAYLYKMNLNGKGETLVKKEPVTAIKVESKKMVAYNDKKVVYQTTLK